MLKRRFSVTVQIKRKDLNQGIKSKLLKLKFEKKKLDNTEQSFGHWVYNY